MTQKQEDALQGIMTVANSIESGLKNVKDSNQDLKAKKTLEAIKKELKKVTRTTETLEDRIQRKLKEL